MRVENLAVGLGDERHMVELQLSDIMEGVQELGAKVSNDYFWDRGDLAAEAMEVLQNRPLQDLYDTERLCLILGAGSADTTVNPAGQRLAG